MMSKITGVVSFSRLVLDQLDLGVRGGTDTLSTAKLQHGPILKVNFCSLIYKFLPETIHITYSSFIHTNSLGG